MVVVFNDVLIVFLLKIRTFARCFTYHETLWKKICFHLLSKFFFGFLLGQVLRAWLNCENVSSLKINLLAADVSLIFVAQAFLAFNKACSTFMRHMSNQSRITGWWKISRIDQPTWEHEGLSTWNAIRMFEGMDNQSNIQ